MSNARVNRYENNWKLGVPLYLGIGALCALLAPMAYISLTGVRHSPDATNFIRLMIFVSFILSLCIYGCYTVVGLKRAKQNISTKKMPTSTIVLFTAGASALSLVQLFAGSLLAIYTSDYEYTGLLVATSVLIIALNVVCFFLLKPRESR